MTSSQKPFPATEPSPSVESGPSGSLPARIRATFLSPGSLGRLLPQSFPWLDVLLISTAIAVLAVLTVPDDVFVDPMREAVTRRGEPVEITSSPEVVAQWGRWMGMMGAIATHPAVAIALAGAMMAIFTVLLRASAGFREYLSISSHVLLIPALGTLVSTALRLAAGGSADVEPAPASSNGLDIVLSIDPFVIWMLIATAFAVHAIDPKVSRVQSSAILLAIYGLFLVASDLIFRLA